MLSQQFHSYTCRCHYGANLMSVTNLKHLICTELNLFNMTLMNWSHSPLRFFVCFFTKLHLHYSWSCLRSCLTLIMYPFTFSDLYRNHMILMIALYTQKKKIMVRTTSKMCQSCVTNVFRAINKYSKAHDIFPLFPQHKFAPHSLWLLDKKCLCFKGKACIYCKLWDASVKKTCL